MSGDLRVVPYDPAESAEWDALVQQARVGHFIFERAYMDYHRDRVADASWWVRLGDRPIAVLPASRHGDEIVSHGGLTFGGLLSTAELTTLRAVSALRALARELDQAGARTLVYKPVPHIYRVVPAEEDLFALVQLGARLVRRDVSAAVPAGDRGRYSSGRRGHIRAASEGLDLAESDRFDAFWPLLRDVLAERHRVAPVHSAAELQLLADRFPGRIRLFTASQGGELVAGTVVFETPHVAHVQYMASGPHGRELQALDALIDHLLVDVFPDVVFDFGISNERDGSLNEGLAQYKESYGARAIVHDRYAIDLAGI
jgi:hypothetical protein